MAEVARYAPLGGTIYGEPDGEPESYSGNNEPDRVSNRLDDETDDVRKGPRLRDAGEYREPDSLGTFSSDTAVHQPGRRVVIDGNAMGHAKDVRIRGSENGVRMADVSLWNMGASSWSSIQSGSTVKVWLGWQEADPHRVFKGTVVFKRRRGKNYDSEYILRCIGEHGKRVKDYYSKTFNNIPPHRMARYVAEDVGLPIGYVSTASSTYTGNYSFSKSRRLSRWFDRLTDVARKHSGYRWVWYIEDGKFYFHPRAEKISETVELGLDKSVLRATPVGNPGSGVDHPHELSMRCEPLLRRGMTVTCDDAPTMPEGKEYRIEEIVHESTETSGRHHTHIVARPVRERGEIYA